MNDPLLIAHRQKTGPQRVRSSVRRKRLCLFRRIGYGPRQRTRRGKVRFPSFPPAGENCGHSLAPPLPSSPQAPYPSLPPLAKAHPFRCGSFPHKSAAFAGAPAIRLRWVYMGNQRPRLARLRAEKCFRPRRSVKKMCQWHIFSVGHSGCAARRGTLGRGRKRILLDSRLWARTLRGFFA